MSGARAAIDRIVAALLALLMASAVANVVWQVFSRFVLGQPSSFTDELARYLLVWIGLLGAGYAVGQRLHVAVDVVPAALERRIGSTLTTLAHAAVFLFALFAMGIGGARLVQLSFALGQTTAALGISLGWIYGIVPATGLLVMFYAGLALVEDRRGAR